MVALLALHRHGDSAARIEVHTGGDEFAPKARIAAIFSGEFPSGMTIVMSAITRGCKCDRLTVIAACRGDSLRMPKPRGAGHRRRPGRRGLERSGRHVVLVLDHDLGAGFRGEQGPGISGGRRREGRTVAAGSASSSSENNGMLDPSVGHDLQEGPAWVGQPRDGNQDGPGDGWKDDVRVAARERDPVSRDRFPGTPRSIGSGSRDSSPGCP